MARKRKTVSTKSSKSRASSRKKDSNTSGDKKAKAPKEPHPLGPLFKQTLLILMFCGAAGSALRAVEKSVHEDPAYVFRPDSLALGRLPDWMVSPSELKGDLTLPFGRVSIFREGLEEEIRGQLEAAPWVGEVVSVTRRLPHDLDVVLVPRRPVARVRLGLQRYTIDAQGVFLPDDAYRDLETLPFIDGLEVRPPEPGRPFASDVLKQALELLKTWKTSDIEEKYTDLKILKITCANPNAVAQGEPEFTVMIPRRVRLYFDAGDEEGEMSYDRALENLQKILFRDPHLRNVTDRIDLRWRRPTLR